MLTPYRLSLHRSIREQRRVIKLIRGSMPRKRKGRKWCYFSRQQCVTSFETARSLANDPSWGRGGLKEKYIFCVPRELQRLLSLFCRWEESVGGAQQGWKFSSMEGKHAPSIYYYDSVSATRYPLDATRYPGYCGLWQI